MVYIFLIVCVVLIVIAANLFCNAVEHVGKMFSISDGVVGAIFAAVGTALPETLIPIVALFDHRDGAASSQVGIGAILGAPFMLSTLSLAVIALFIIKRRGMFGRIRPDWHVFRRDILCFLLSYTLVLVSLITYRLPYGRVLSYLCAFGLLFNYIFYVVRTIMHSSGAIATYSDAVLVEEPLFISRFVLLQYNLWSLLLQLLLALLLLIYSAEWFIVIIKQIANSYQVSPFLMSLIIIPIATELPEKINSIIWLRRGKDTLAISNITGAMVFQGSIIPIVGIIFHNWRMTNTLPLINIATTIIAALWLYNWARRRHLQTWHLLGGGILYIIGIAMSLLLLY
jgi:cation:H+ antiporter